MVEEGGRPAAEEAARAEAPQDLGFGTVVARESRRRLLNRDGSFNVVREGLRPLGSLSLYHSLLTLSWPRFLALLAAGYLLVNLLFAAAYVACGPGALAGSHGITGPGRRFFEAFFFSVQTFATIGYGRVTPTGLVPNLVVTCESVVGLLGFALATGLVFARFSRPTARIVFSEVAVVAPYRGGRALELRIANARSNELVELDAKMVLSRWRPDGGSREFFQLELERDHVAFFPLSWTLVHPIDEGSPLWGVGPRELAAADTEILVLLTGIDETFSQIVHARSSYEADEIVWEAGFTDVFNPPRPDGILSIDMRRIHRVEPRPLPPPDAHPER